ncbi:MAG: flavin reductase family protein [Burkholderiales bacterium]|jgi:flavin reductase (DIM6/NTAB) family NADH-FMN oxidoreductase RutF|nr:flavin reductase family protein [Burkholderiales bacterium]
MKKRSLPLGRVYRLLEPGPVVLLTTAHAGRANVMTMSWLTMIDFDPPLVGCVVSDRNYSFGLLRRSRQCVINVPTADLAAKVVACGNCSGRHIDKFARFGLTAVPASQVAAPLLEECFASLECRVADSRWARRYCLFVLEVVKAWVDPSDGAPTTLHHRGRGEFMIAGRTIRLPSRMK